MHWAIIMMRWVITTQLTRITVFIMALALWNAWGP